MVNELWPDFHMSISLRIDTRETNEQSDRVSIVFHGQYTSQYTCSALHMPYTMKRGRKSTAIRQALVYGSRISTVRGRLRCRTKNIRGRVQCPYRATCATRPRMINRRRWIPISPCDLISTAIFIDSYANVAATPHCVFPFGGYSIVIRISEQDKPDTRRRLCEHKNTR